MKRLILFCALASVVSCKPAATPRPGTVGVITTIAGNLMPGFNGDGGPATAARIQYPTGVALDDAGNVYIADAGNMRIRKISTDGIINTVGGNGNVLYSGDGGPATAAGIGVPSCIVTDADGNVYFADSRNRRIRKIRVDGMISTVAGTGAEGYGGDGGPATQAQLMNPSAITFDVNGNMYVTDVSNRVRKISATGIITTIAGGEDRGYSGDGGPASVAHMNIPTGVAVDAAGNVYIADNGNQLIRRINPAGIINKIAGVGGYGYTAGDNGPATAAQLYMLGNITLDAAGNLYAIDYNRIRKITPAGGIYTVAGNGEEGWGGDGAFAVNARLNTPTGIAVDSRGVIYIADRGNNRIRKVGR